MNINKLPRPLIEIEPLDKDQFLKVVETLTRCGLRASPENEDEKPILWQSCHILHKQNKYYIVHFKELFLIDGKKNRTEIQITDYERRNMIAKNLESWGLIKLITEIPDPDPYISITIIPFKERKFWDMRCKYTIGKNQNDKERKS